MENNPIRFTDPDGMACAGCGFDPQINPKTGNPFDPDYAEHHPGDAPKPQFDPSKFKDKFERNIGESANAGPGPGIGGSLPPELLARVKNVPKWLWAIDVGDQEIPVLDVITDAATLYYLLQSPAMRMSKGGQQNVWPDQYGYPPNVGTVDWSKGDQPLADEKSKEAKDTKKGPGTPNNKAKKWFRDKRPPNPPKTK